jgi:hypothetical protein
MNAGAGMSANRQNTVGFDTLTADFNLLASSFRSQFGCDASRDHGIDHVFKSLPRSIPVPPPMAAR